MNTPIHTITNTVANIVFITFADLTSLAKNNTNASNANMIVKQPTRNQSSGVSFKSTPPIVPLNTQINSVANIGRITSSGMETDWSENLIFLYFHQPSIENIHANNAPIMANDKNSDIFQLCKSKS